MTKKVLVTDADYRQTLAIARAISSDYEVHLGSNRSLSCGFYSKFAKGRMLYDISSTDAFAFSINKYLQSEKIDVLLPVGDNCTFLASLVKDKIQAKVPVANLESMLIARSKVQMSLMARKAGLNVPELVNVPSRFPAVVKPVSGQGSLRFVNNQRELSESTAFYASKGIPYFVSEYIDGIGNYSFTGLLDDGKLKAFFMHKEIREYPLTGGSATFAVSSYDDAIKSKCQKLLEDLKWTGVAMVEFKINSKSELYFMEVNPKFWASLEIAIASGVNFPLLLLKMISGEEITPPKYIVGLRFRWLAEDILNFISKPNGAFVKSFKEKSFEDVHLDDLPPHVVRIFKQIADFYLRKKRLGMLKARYPYGVPSTKQ